MSGAFLACFGVTLLLLSARNLSVSRHRRRPFDDFARMSWETPAGFPVMMMSPSASGNLLRKLAI